MKGCHAWRERRGQMDDPNPCTRSSRRNRFRSDGTDRNCVSEYEGCDPDDPRSFLHEDPYPYKNRIINKRRVYLKDEHKI